MKDSLTTLEGTMKVCGASELSASEVDRSGTPCQART